MYSILAAIVNNTVMHIKVGERIDLKSSITRKKNSVTVWWQMLTTLIVVITIYTNIKLCLLYVNTSVKKRI